jgi:hypothetical protein
MRHSPGIFSRYQNGGRIVQGGFLNNPTEIKHFQIFTKELTTDPAVPMLALQENLEVIPDEIDEAARIGTCTLVADDEDADGRGCEASTW